MAIVFISPKQRQRIFFTGIIVFFGLVLVVISLFVFLTKPKPTPEQIVFNRPKIDINLQVLDSDEAKILETPEQMNLKFKYTAITKNGKQTTGEITAVSEEEAQKTLKDMGLENARLEEEKTGRENPFAPYYQQAPASPAKIK